MKNNQESLFHQQLRTIVERVFGYIKCWAFVAKRCQLAPELQEICLMVIYQLVNQITAELPLLTTLP